jgi:hypothetical protein
VTDIKRVILDPDNPKTYPEGHFFKMPAPAWQFVSRELTINEIIIFIDIFEEAFRWKKECKEKRKEVTVKLLLNKRNIDKCTLSRTKKKLLERKMIYQIGKIIHINYDMNEWIADI